MKTTTIPLRLGAYGKLPLSPEYLAVGCFGGSAGDFREWIDQGFECASRALGSEIDLGRSWRILFLPEGRREAVVATMRQSADQGRARAFPYSVFTTIERRHLDEQTSCTLRQLNTVWQELNEYETRLASLHSLEAYRDEVAAAELAPFDAEAPVSVAPDVGVQALAGSLCGDRTAMEDFARLLWDIRCPYRTIDSGRIPGSRLPGLRLPLAAGIDAFTQVLAWIGCLEASAFLGGRGAAPVTVAFPASAGAGTAMWLVRRPPQARDFMMMAAIPAGLLFPPPEALRQDLRQQPAFMRQAQQALLGNGQGLHVLAELSLESLA